MRINLNSVLLVASIFCVSEARPGKDKDRSTPLFGNSFGVPENATYDYIIVGGGTAGLTVAARLAENPSISVAVIEAGGFYELENGNGSVIPGLAPLQDTSIDPTRPGALPLIDWGIVTQPQKEMDNRTLHYARGKTLGGSSARNFMAFHRATAGTYQRWADTVGDSSYTWEKWLPYFKKSVEYTPADRSKRQSNGTVRDNPSAYSRKGGPLQLTFPNWASPFATWAIKGMQAIGLFHIDGLNSGKLLGVAWCTTNIDPESQHRSSSQSSFLDEAIESTSLKVYAHSLAKKILFDQAKTATGVVVSTAGISYVLTARKEIILSAGAFQSPQLLMVSGVGPRETLSKFNIPIVADRPGVGANLEDHVFTCTSYRVNVETSSRGIGDAVFAAKNSANYLEDGTGPLTQAFGGPLGWEKIPTAERKSFSKTTLDALAKYPADWPEVEYLTLDSISTGADPMDGFNYASICTALVAPLSRGTVTINSTDTANLPLIDMGFLTHEGDREVLVAGLKRVRQIWKTIGDVTIGEEVTPGPEVVSDDEIYNYGKTWLSPVWHASSSCAMGKKADPMAVVDSNSVVIGVQSLRVVDAAAFPLLVPGHPQATIFALAEKIAANILAGI